MAILKKLRLYKDFTPNTDGANFFGFYSLNDYMEQINAYYDDEIDANNYRINALSCQVKGNKDNITYIIDYEIDTEQSNKVINYKCYHVTNYIFQSGMTILTLSVDNWATYFNKVKIFNPFLKRCNKKITDEVGTYDPIKETYIKNVSDLLDLEPLEGNSTAYNYIKTYNDNNVCIVFIASLVVARNVTGTEQTTAIVPLACPLSYLRGLCTQEMQNRYGTIEIATQIISGITSLNYSSTQFINGDVNVLKVFILPNDAINPTDYGYTFNTKCKCLSIENDTQFTATILKPSKYIKYFNINVANMDVNKKYYVGVVNDGLELTHYTQNNYVTYTFEVNYDGVSVVVAQGDNTKDISSHFEVSLIGSSISQDALQKIGYYCKAVATSINIATKKTASGAIGDILGVASDVFSNRPKATGTIGNSDATLVYGWSNVGKDKVIVPYYFTKYKSIFNEKIHALYFGVNYNVEHINTNLMGLLTYVNYYDMLITGEGHSAYNFAVFECCVTGAPLEACEDIKNKLAKGIYFSIRQNNEDD